MRSDFLPHPCSGRVRDVPVPDSERELKSLKISLKICPSLHKNPCFCRRFRWRRGSESDRNHRFIASKIAGFTGVSSTICQNSPLLFHYLPLLSLTVSLT